MQKAGVQKLSEAVFCRKPECKNKAKRFFAESRSAKIKRSGFLQKAGVQKLSEAVFCRKPECKN
ncbi:Uncharacterized protein dnm_017540 [Desulfonema magnum]|uniref:Uncharacterized protein n=1 Tax=Desulfonema magnum TaxID=45655 RepID=A0A975GLM3_9BACT|nr:Uncharacterized protein dnm_017540 [Desulfonema magnum]